MNNEPEGDEPQGGDMCAGCEQMMARMDQLEQRVAALEGEDQQEMAPPQKAPAPTMSTPMRKGPLYGG